MFKLALLSAVRGFLQYGGVRHQETTFGVKENKKAFALDTYRKTGEKTEENIEGKKNDTKKKKKKKKKRRRRRRRRKKKRKIKICQNKWNTEDY